MKTTIKEEWKTFNKVVFQDMKVVPKVQFDETKKAFYAGFIVCLRAVHELGVGQIEDSVAVLNSLREESVQWQAELQKEADAQAEANRRRGDC